MGNNNIFAMIMKFEGCGELIIDNSHAIDVSRSGKQVHINITNTNGDLAFNDLYDRILEYLGEHKTFDVIMKLSNEKSIKFCGIVAEYHLNPHRELLRLWRK